MPKAKQTCNNCSQQHQNTRHNGRQNGDEIFLRGKVAEFDLHRLSSQKVGLVFCDQPLEYLNDLWIE